ncbi:MAG TPA: transcriptional activator RfaH, partial [Oceanospirillales bacterium]|nr:transcriptional activator RfaH [Oceanospirillales bacterium]
MKQWLAVHSKPRQETIAEENLARQGFEVYCPKIQIERKKRGKRIKVIEALFPRYLFVKFKSGHDSATSIRYTRGVTQIVRFGNELAIVSDDIIR